MPEKDTVWASIEAMPEFQEKTPEEKLGYATYFIEKQATNLAPDLAGNPEAQGYFRDKSKEFLFGIADRHFPSAIQAAPSQIGESIAREDRSLSLSGARLNTEIGKQAQETLAGLAGKEDSEALKGDPSTFKTISPTTDTTVGEYRAYLESVVEAQAVKGGRKGEDLVESFAESATRTPSAAMLKLQLSEGWLGWDELIAKSEDPFDTAVAAIAGTMLESGVQSAKGAIAGLGVTAATGNPIAGGVAMGGVAAESEYQATYLGELQEELQKRGDASAETIQAVLADDDFNARVDKKAMTRGLTIGATEAVAGGLSFGIANKIGASTAKKALKIVGVESGIGMAGGSGGEFLARLFSGEDYWTPEARKDIASEGIAELSQAGTGVASVAFERATGQLNSTPDATTETETTAPAPAQMEAGQTAPEPVTVPETQSVAEPEIDDAPVRSVIEEFSDEEVDVESDEEITPVIEVEIEPITEVAPEVIPPSPIEEISLADEPAPDAETAKPAIPPAIPDTEVNTPDATDSETTIEPVQTFSVDDALAVKIYQNEDGTARVEKVNTETGQTIELDGAQQSFPSRADALGFVRDRFRTDEQGEIIQEATADMAKFEETDPLMLLLQQEKMSPVQDDIRNIGRIANREKKGFRALDSDQAKRSDYNSVPLLSEYRGVAQERLRSVYQRGSENRPDQIAQMAFDRGLIDDASPSSLFQGIRDRLEKVGGENQITSGEQAQAASEANDVAMERDYVNFTRDLKSPYRRGGLIEAGALQVGDVIEVAGYPATVTSRDDDSISINSQNYGEIALGLDEKIGYDTISENGIPDSERENIATEDRVSREDAATLTEFLQEKLGDPRIAAVPSREHSALAKNKLELEAARRLAKFFNRRVVGVRNLPANGAVSRADNQNIYVAIDSTRTELLIVAHELLHQMRQTDADLYQDLLDTLDADLDAYLADKRGEHSDKSVDMLVEEFLADYLSDRSADPAFWESLAVRNPDLFERFVDFIRQFLAGIRERILSERVGVERYLRDQTAMQRTMEDVLIAFKARQSQDRKGILDVPLEDSMPFADVRFADRRNVTFNEEGEVIPPAQMERGTKPNQQIYGQDIGREDEIQSKAEVQAAVKPYFDGDSTVSYWSKDAAFSVLADIEGGHIDPTEETGLDGANQALVSELWKFANDMLREDGDASLLNRMRGRVNDYWNREATRAARALNARGWASTPMEGTLGEVEKSKKAAVEKTAPGTEIVGDIETIQSDADNIAIKPADFSAKEDAEVLASIKGKRQTSAPGAPGTAGEIALSGGRKKVGNNLRKVASKLDALLNTDNDILFADSRVDDGNRRTLVQQLLLTQAQKGNRKRGAFIKVAMDLGLTEEVAANRFDRIAEIRAEAKTARELDAQEASQDKEEPTAEEKLLAELDEEASRLDRLNDKAKKISERLTAGPKKRVTDPSKKAPLDKIVSDAIEAGTSREEIIRQGLFAGLKQEAAARMADAIIIEQQRRSGRRKKGEKKSIDARARDLAKRFDNPQDRPVRQRDELRVLINETLREKSSVTEQGFMDRMKALGASKADSADLWASVSRERVNRQGIRNLRRQVARERQQANAAQNEVETIIKRLAASQSDTQDNRPRKRQESIVRELYRDAIGYGPVRSRARFVSELEAAGVDSTSANRLFDVAMRERQNRTTVGKDSDANRIFGKPNLPATDRTYPAMKAEILAHPQLKLVGPEQRLNIMASIFRDRAGLSDVDSRAAAVKFDAQLVGKWEEAQVRLAEEMATKRNAPWFRREPGSLDAKVAVILRAVEEGKRDSVSTAFNRFSSGAINESQFSQEMASLGIRRDVAEKLKRLVTGVKAQKTTFDRLREAIRAGAMDPRKRLLDEVAKSNGWMDLTDTELQRLSELDAALADPNITPFEDVRYKTEMSRVIRASALASPLSKTIREYYLASIFSGVKTWLLQTSVLFNEIANLGLRDPAVALVEIAKGNSAPLDGYLTAMGNIGRYLKNAATDGGLAFLTGDIRGIQEAEILAAVSGLEQVHDRNVAIWRNPRSTFAQKTAAATKIALAANRFFFRVLSGLDNTFQGFIRTYTAELEAFTEASALGIEKKKMREMTGEVLNLVNAFAEEADGKGFTRLDKQAFVNDRVSMAIFAGLKGEGVNLDGVRERSFREAAIETGVADFQTGTLPFGKLAKHLQKWSNEGGLISTLLVPVVRTPYQVLHRSAWWSPYGIVRFLNTAKKTGGFTDWKATPYETAMADPVQMMRRAAETTLGTAAFVALALLQAREEGEDEEDKTFRINLSGPTTANRSEFTAWRETGRRPFSIQFKAGDKWITLGFRKGGMEFFNFAATLLGSWDQRKYNSAATSGSDMMNYVSTLGTEMTGEMLFFLRGFSSRYALANEEKMANQMGFMLSGFVPAASLLKTPNKIRDYQENESGALTSFLMQMPVLPLMGENMPMLNSLGDPLGAKESEQSYVQSQFGMPIGWVPFKKRAGNTEAAQDEDLYKMMFAQDYFPSVKSRSDFPDLSLNQYRDFVKTRGGMIKSFMRENYGALSMMEPDKFKEVISTRATKITKSVQKSMGI